MENEATPRQDSRTINTYLSTAFKESQNRIALADGKANILLGIIGLLFSLSVSDILSKGEAVGAVMLLVIVPFVVSGAFALATVFPRFSKKTSGSRSTLFFGEAANLNAREFAQKMNSTSEEEIYEDYLKNIQVLSGIIGRKFLYLRWGYIFLAFGFIGKIIVTMTVF